MCKNLVVVYIEEVALQNFVVNGALLSLAVTALKLPKSRIRVLLSALIGATFAVCLPFVGRALVVYKTCALICTTAFAAKYGRFKKYLLFIVVFSALSFIAGGAAYAFLGMTLTSGSALAYSGGKAVKYAVTGAFAFLWVFSWEAGRFAARRRISASDARSCELFINDNRLKVSCFNDTGNRIIDSVTGKSVVILSNDIGKPYVDEKSRKIEIATVHSVKSCPVVLADKIVIHNSDGDKVFEKIPVAVADNVFSEFKLIYNADAL